MSVDIYLEPPAACVKCGHPISFVQQDLNLNFTHNAQPFWHKLGILDIIYHSQGHRAGEYVERLEKAYVYMASNLNEFILIEPSNGWGRAEHAVEFLKKVWLAFAAAPDAVIRISA